jgi:dTDP-4-amino-4,6-dideoxygalactose transaminase
MSESSNPKSTPPQDSIVPFFRPQIGQDEIDEVVACLQSGWLTTGPRTRLFERQFAEAVGARYAVALNSCTAALHLAVHALDLSPGQGVLVPTMTFAATAEVIQYEGGVPILVDCDPDTLNIDLEDAAKKLQLANDGKLPVPCREVVGIMPVHYGGQMCNMDAVQRFATANGLWVVEDAAHALPSRYWSHDAQSMIHAGQGTADATCFSFYANKTITTGEGGMLTTDDEALAEKVRCLSLHGLSNTAWRRFEHAAAWDYRILTAGYKYNLTDIASAIGIHQLARANEFQQQRQAIADQYNAAFADGPLLSIPTADEDRLHAWHLYPILLNLSSLAIDRNTFCEQLRDQGIGFSVHWRPLHLHPFYEQDHGWPAELFPNASMRWPQLVSLPIFAGMTSAQTDRVIDVVRSTLASGHRSTDTTSTTVVEEASQSQKMRAESS